MADPMPPVPTIAVVVTETPQRRAVNQGSVPGGLASVDVTGIGGDLSIHPDSSVGVLGSQ